MPARHRSKAPSVPDPDVLDFCCKRKKCPRLARGADGSVVITDSELPGVEIRFSAEQAALAARWLLDRG